MENIHFVVSTGQNVANLIPLLEIAQTHEPIIILSSSSMQKSGRSEQLKTVLEQKGYYRIQILPITDEELLGYNRLKTFIQGYIKDWKGSLINFYLNGGQKLPVLAIREAFSPFSVRMIYMDSRKTQLMIVEGSQTKYMPIQYPIQLVDVLQLYGSEIKPHNEQRIYKEGVFRYQLNFPPEIQAFASDKKVALELLQLVQELNARALENPDHIINNTQFWHWLKRQTIDFRNQKVQKIVGILNEASHIRSEAKDKNDRERFKALENKMVNEVEQLVEWAMAQPKKRLQKYMRHLQEPIVLPEETRERLRKVGITLSNPVRGFPMGAFFESAVTYRLIRFFEYYPDILNSISEIWTNVEFQSVDNTGKPTAEYDILLLMKNGIIIALECKSFDFEEKDLFSRIARLMRRGGLLSEFWVVLPVFTNEQFRNLLKKQHNLYAKLKDLGMTIVPFTLPNQPPNLVLSETKQEFEIKQFEDELTLLLKRFFPSA